MTSFALITEGITDQAILENILDGLTDGKAITRALRPLRDETDKSRVAEKSFSNWELVLEYIGSESLVDAITTNDYIVIQIDTDICEHQNFGVPLHEQGKMKEISVIVQECIQKLLTLLYKDFPQEELGRLLFAIPVLSAECWLVSLTDHSHTHCTKTVNGCEVRLHKMLQSKRIAYRKDYDIYLRLSSPLRKKKILEAVSGRVSCLKLFLEQTEAKISV